MAVRHLAQSSESRAESRKKFFVFKFEKLAVRHKAVAFADLVYRHSRQLPDEERFGLTNQIRRAANSISSNIAEGSARSDPDFARFLGYAAGSLYEVITQTIIAYNQGLVSEREREEIYSAGEEIGRMLTGLRDSLG